MLEISAGDWRLTSPSEWVPFLTLWVKINTAIVVAVLIASFPLPVRRMEIDRYTTVKTACSSLLMLQLLVASLTSARRVCLHQLVSRKPLLECQPGEAAHLKGINHIHVINIFCLMIPGPIYIWDKVAIRCSNRDQLEWSFLGLSKQVKGYLHWNYLQVISLTYPSLAPIRQNPSLCSLVSL